MRVVILRERVSIGPFLLRGVFICSFEGCSKDSMYLFFSFFLDTLFLYMRSCNHLLTYIVLISLFILMYVFLSPTPSCVVSFLSLYTCFLIFVYNLLFMFHTKMPWWVLFKVFQKYRLLKSTCHKLSSCKVFQEFVLG